MYRTILSVFFPVFFVLALCSQILIIYMILCHSPKNIQTMKYFLCNTCLFQVIHVCMSFLTQLRQVSHLTPLEIWSYGPIRYFEAHVGYCMYHVLQSSALISSMSVFTTIYLKFEAARCINIPKSRLIKAVLLIFTPVFLSITFEIISIVTQSLPSEIRESFLLLNANSTEYSVIGIMNLDFWPMRFNFYIISSSVVLIPTLGLILRRKITWQLKSTMDRLSQFNRAQNQTFVNGLTIQAVLPVIFYVPIFFSMFYVMVTKAELVFQQFFIFVVPVLPCLLDPYITIYFVTPYRKTMRIWLRIDKKNVISVAAMTSNVY